MSLTRPARSAIEHTDRAGWALTLRMTFEVTRGGVFGKAPEADIRAAMGRALAEKVCPYVAADVLPCQQCLMRSECAYPQAFKPLAELNAPSAPAPYVLSYRGSDRVWAGGAFCLDLTVVGQRRAKVIDLERALVDAFAVGVGRRGARIRARLVSAHPLAPFEMPTTERLRVICRTPIAVKRKALRPGWTASTFNALVTDRLAALSRAFGDDGCPTVPEHPIVALRPALEVVTRRGYSTSQRQGIEARGWIGSFEVAGWRAWGDALMTIARIGVGRHTAWGNGQLHFEGIAPRRGKGRR